MLRVLLVGAVTSARPGRDHYKGPGALWPPCKAEWAASKGDPPLTESERWRVSSYLGTAVSEVDWDAPPGLASTAGDLDGEHLRGYQRSKAAPF